MIGSRAKRCRSGRRGLTLVEMLVVIALLAMLATVATGFLSGTAASADRARAIAAVRRVDAMARVLARTTGAVRLELVDDGERIATRLAAAPASSDAEWTTVLPEGTTLGLLRDRLMPAVEIDATGRSIDFAYVLNLDSGEVTLDVAGRTGQLTERAGERR